MTEKKVFVVMESDGDDNWSAIAAFPDQSSASKFEARLDAIYESDEDEIFDRYSIPFYDEAPEVQRVITLFYGTTKDGSEYTSFNTSHTVTNEPVSLDVASELIKGWNGPQLRVIAGSREEAHEAAREAYPPMLAKYRREQAEERLSKLDPKQLSSHNRYQVLMDAVKDGVPDEVINARLREWAAQEQQS